MRESDTGVWFIKGDQLREWKVTKSSILWVHGIRAYYIHSHRCGLQILTCEGSREWQIYFMVR